jgi:glutamate carboxypeptidase
MAALGDAAPALPGGLTGDRLLTLAAIRATPYLEALAELVAVDSGTDSPDGVNRMADRMTELLTADGWSLTRTATRPVADRRFGDVLVARRRGAGGATILLLGHLDTVFPDGTAAQRPLRIEEGRAYGPGVSDMKAGLLTGLHAAGVLFDAGFDGFGEVVFLLNPDEERGSPASRPFVVDEVERADAVLVLEAARENGDVVTSRKGVTTARIEIEGRAAHAGVEPERGRSAVLEAARKIETLHQLNDRWPGATVNVGVVHAGTRSNVVPERAALDIDVRAATEDALVAVEAEVERIGALCEVDGVRSTATLVKEVRPMERTPGTARLFEAAQAIARELGFELGEAATGGASDANTSSALGVPTLDGLGPIGGDDHSEREWMDVASVVPRTALLAGLIAAIGVDGV